jgi:hypothetical protein
MADAAFRLVGSNVLWSMPPRVVQALAGDNLAWQAMYVDNELRDLFDEESEWMLESSSAAPVIYMLALVDDMGQSPSSANLRQVIAMLRQYISHDPQDDHVVLKVDNALRGGRSSRSFVELGHHGYLGKTQDGGHGIVNGREAVVRQFCDALEKRLNALDRVVSAQIPLRRPLMYIGYAFSYAKRMASHKRGDSSFLMQLVRSVARVLWGTEYDIEAFPICFLAEEDEVRLAELILTQIADSFSWTGGGFNAHPPGINNSSAELGGVAAEDVREFWQAREQFRRNQGFWDAAREAETSELERRCDATEAPEENLTGSMPASQGYESGQRETLQEGRHRAQVLATKLGAARRNAEGDCNKNLLQVEKMIEDMDSQGIDPGIIDRLRRELDEARGEE